jgi:Spy/CpxP family protein refolding chaperone
MMLPGLMKGVGLTEAQQTQVKQIVAAHQPQFEKLLSQLRATREQLAEKLFAPGPVKGEELAPLRQQLGHLRDQLTQEALQVALDIRGVLTPEQIAKAGQIRKRVNELRAEMRTLLGRDQ